MIHFISGNAPTDNGLKQKSEHETWEHPMY